MTADQMLASLSDSQLHEGIAKGKRDLAFIDEVAPFDINEDRGDGPFPPSKSFETWATNFHEDRRRLLLMAVADCEAELKRRQLASITNPN